MESHSTSQKNSDAENLNLLAIFHYIVGGIGFVVACFPIVHLLFGVLLIAGPGHVSGQGGSIPAIFGYVFAGFAALLILLGWSMAICSIVSGRMIAKRRNRVFSFVIGAILCVFFPFGTVLGVFTVILLNKDSVKTVYSQGE